MPVAAPYLEARVVPPWPYRLPRAGKPDGLMRVRGGVVHRLLAADGPPVLVRAWTSGPGVAIRAEPAPGSEDLASGERLEWALERMRFALGVDIDLSDFHDAFREDSLLGPAIRRRPWIRPRRNPTPWEALAWAITAQLIESGRAAEIQRRMVRRWGPRAAGLRDSPSPDAIAACAPAELVACDLTERRALAMRRCAREVAAGRIDLERAEPARSRLLAIPEIGPWTIQCLGLSGRGDPDELPAGDLAYIKIVGRLAGLGRRATVEEVEEFFRPYAPYRGLAGTFVIVEYARTVAQGPPLRLAA